MAFSNKPRTMKKMYKRKPKTVKKVIKTALRKQKVKYIKSIVQSVVKKNVETKASRLGLFSGSPIGGGGIQLNNGNQSGAVRTLLPAVLPGTTASQRIGNKIKPQALVVKGYVKSNEYDAITNTNTRPYYAHIWVVVQKSINRYFDINGQALFSSSPQFKYDAALGQPVLYDGSITNDLLPTNTLSYKILAHRRIKLDSMAPLISYGTQPVNTVPLDSVNNGCKYAQPFNITLRGKVLPKQLLYDPDTTGLAINIPQNFAPLMYVALENMDGSLSSYTQQRFSITTTSTLYYEDA